MRVQLGHKEATMEKPEVHGVLCDVCGEEITSEQKLVQIPGIGFMHDATEVPTCKMRSLKGLVKPAEIHLCRSISDDLLLVTQDEAKAQTFCDDLNAKQGNGWAFYDTFALDQPIDGWWLR